MSPKTVRRTLKRAGLKALVKQKKPKLINRHVKARYEFAVKYKNWTFDDWTRVIFSDETKINRFGSDGRSWVWKEQGAPLQEHHVKGGSLMMWGCMTYDGVGYACKIEGNTDAALYTNILEDELQQSVEYFEMDRTKVIFQQNNDRKHMSKKVLEWFKNHLIQLLDWRAQSPDHNPIEH